ncbi:MAG: response regulator [Magnetococcales bacterium]|nr:response regulator [Magnetococcales bacterium]MBF0155911.1 response regulator [Magnetococcales bacterium]
MKVLIADDELANRLLLRDILRSMATCDMVTDGEEAVEIFRTDTMRGAPYDLVLLDIMMPRMDGQQALREIRKAEREAEVPPGQECVVIMVTALDSPKDVVEAFYQGGCTDYLIKPFTRRSLLAKMEKHGLLG